MTTLSKPSARPWLAGLLFVDVCLYLDTTLRWENGFGFARSSWLVTTLEFVAGVAVCNSLLLRWRVPFWLHAAFGLAALTLGFVLASTGNQYFNWHSTPTFTQFLVKDGLDIYWIFQGGLSTASSGAIAHGLLGRAWRQTLQVKPPRTRAQAFFAVGLSLVVMSFVRFVPPVTLLADRAMPDGSYRLLDPRSNPEGVATLRSACWLALFTLGLLSIAGAAETWRRSRRRESL